MTTVNLSFDVPAAHVAPLRAYLDIRYGEAIDGMTDVQALEYHVVQSTVPGYKNWHRGQDAAVLAAKSSRESNNATRAAAEAADSAALASAQNAAEAAAGGAVTGLS